MDDVFRNYSLSTDSYDYSSEENQVAGKREDDKNFPYGGFPPIYVCKDAPKEDVPDKEDKEKREYTTHKTAVSIKDILEKRRGITPFI